MNSLNSSRFGRVEVQYKGVWGTICGDSWDLRDADVVCRQLGYERALSAPRDTTFLYPTPGQNTGQIWLDEVNCEGSETSISDCKHLGFAAHDCRYYFNAGVVCRPTSKAMKHLIKIILKISSSFLFSHAPSNRRLSNELHCSQPRLTCVTGTMKDPVTNFQLKF